MMSRQLICSAACASAIALVLLIASWACAMTLSGVTLNPTTTTTTTTV